MLTLVFNSPVAVQFKTNLSPFRACTARATEQSLLGIVLTEKVILKTQEKNTVTANQLFKASVGEVGSQDSYYKRWRVRCGKWCWPAAKRGNPDLTSCFQRQKQCQQDAVGLALSERKLDVKLRNRPVCRAWVLLTVTPLQCCWLFLPQRESSTCTSSMVKPDGNVHDSSQRPLSQGEDENHRTCRGINIPELERCIISSLFLRTGLGESRLRSTYSIQATRKHHSGKSVLHSDCSFQFQSVQRAGNIALREAIHPGPGAQCAGPQGSALSKHVSRRIALISVSAIRANRDFQARRPQTQDRTSDLIDQ
ncbi:hypothetical protein EYF80_000752 [Liparis tanakae]|uniref:Uncharacterized protein n=1 Tax=Liparis tanakae TaxID=230148 RepID=A0A4Z2JGK2_9TELE|nr:hypothetical protein EYF80_000752 [Liparis tanakae]